MYTHLFHARLDRESSETLVAAAGRMKLSRAAFLRMVLAVLLEPDDHPQRIALLATMRTLRTQKKRP